MASQDKVQALLENVLEQSLPLIHKGIFTAEQLQTSMCQRQKHENNMMKPTFKLSDYLKAIQYQYSLERSRRSRIQSLSSTNPLFKKQSKTDFIIMKRIIKLWDRTMHKFKYDLDLWKQYLQFCIVSEAKKQFYKALSWALRFLPYSEQLWLIGVYYEVEVGHNLWKARKIFIKSLKMNSKKQNLWLQMFKFEIKFLEILVGREQAIEGKEEFNFIISKQENEQIHGNQEDQSQKQHKMQQQGQIDDLNFNKFDQILSMVFEEAINKIEEGNKQRFQTKILETLTAKIKQHGSKNKTIKDVLLKTLKSIHNSISKMNINKVKKQGKTISKIQLINSANMEQKQKYYQHCLNDNSNLSVLELDKIVSQFVTKPQYLNSLISHFLSINPTNCLTYLQKTKLMRIQNLPASCLSQIVSYLFNEEIDNNINILKSLIPKINPSKYIQSPLLLQTLININKKLRNFKANNDIFRSVSVLCKKEPEVIERCLNLIHKNDDYQ